MDHEYNSCTWNEEWPDTINEEIYETDIENTNINVPEKIGDDYLIELYRERRFLYDKKHRDFKDNELKHNAWEEISLIMTKDKNLGNYYTAEYCKKRMTTLREQYVKLKKECDLKSGSAACTKKKSSLLSQLSFLQEFIQRRRTLTNIKENENTQRSAINENTQRSAFNKNVATWQETKGIDNVNNREFETSSSSQDNTEYNSTEDPICYKKPCKIKKGSFEKNENNDVLRDLSNAAMNICTQLQLNPPSHENSCSKSAEQAFSEFITFTLQGMNESERNIRRNKIFQDLIAPIDQL